MEGPFPVTYRNYACELDAAEKYVGPKKSKPKTAFNPRIDVFPTDYVLLRPEDDDLQLYPVHLGQVLDEVVEGPLDANGKITHVCPVKYF